ncbi:hypothetical protein ACF1BE_17890 [Streptomyces sp. NPDC014991]|uniref:hypothetical protein n=1 Tax=Streptomyces sp. NPDC014991 TaxID=3364935 RepID=UPI0037005AB8
MMDPFQNPDGRAGAVLLVHRGGDPGDGAHDAGPVVAVPAASARAPMVRSWGRRPFVARIAVTLEEGRTGELDAASTPNCPRAAGGRTMLGMVR